jgi:hypothetical protein
MMNAKNSRIGSVPLASKSSIATCVTTLLLTAAIAGLPGCTKQEEVGSNETMNEVHDVAAEAKANIRDEAAEARNKIQEESREAREEIKDATADEG